MCVLKASWDKRSTENPSSNTGLHSWRYKLPVWLIHMHLCEIYSFNWINLTLLLFFQKCAHCGQFFIFVKPSHLCLIRHACEGCVCVLGAKGVCSVPACLFWTLEQFDHLIYLPLPSKGESQHKTWSDFTQSHNNARGPLDARTNNWL